MRANKALLFLPIGLAQLAVPSWMIYKHESVMREGAVYKFRTAPIDPIDPFRGEYVVLDFAAETGRWICPGAGIDAGTTSMFASLGTDSLGFAKLTALSLTPPEGPHLSVTLYRYDVDSSIVIERVSLPFDRYYLEEGEGARTEQLLGTRWVNDERVPPLEAYALVRVYEGDAVIEDLIVDERPISEWMKEEASKGE